MKVLVVLLLTFAGLTLAVPVTPVVCVKAGPPCVTWWHPHTSSPRWT